MDALPEECMVQMLTFVACLPRSLHALLLTNRTLFRLCAAIIYQNPFEYLERHVTSIQERQSRQVKVLRLFLACIPGTLDAITTASTTTSASPLPGFRKPTIDYLALYNCHSEKLLHFLITPALSCIPNTTLTSSSTLSTRQQQAQQGQPPHHTERSPLQAQPRRLLPGLTGVQAQIHLGLVGHTPQHIRTIGYSIHGLAALQPLINQLSHLARLELYKKSNRPEISSATRFIIAHRCAHQSLQEIKIKTDDHSDLTPLIEAMGQPQVVDVSSWADADFYLHLFPLQKCRVLQMRQGLSRSASKIAVDILASLTSLRVLRMTAFHQSMFSWATGQCAGAQGVLLDRGLGLPSITSISLYGLDTHMVPAFMDAVTVFHSTLQTVIGLSSFDIPSTMGLAWSQSLPRLTRLDLEGTIALRFDLTCLSHCPVIQDLRLNIGRRIPDDWDPLLKAQQLAR
ncbi:hypothetical protein BGX29_007344, partial [Mortierella sp. GBA35]